MSRVTAWATDDPAVTDLTVVAHARVVITGVDGRRLHEEVIYAGGRVTRIGRFTRIDALEELRAVLAARPAGTPDRLVEEQLDERWDRIRDPLFASLEARAKTRFTSLTRTLSRSAEREKADIATVLTELKDTISAELDTVAPSVEQLELDFGENERAQLRADLDALRARLYAIPAEIAEEHRLIDARYASQHPLLFPAAVTFVVPRRLASDLEAGT
jgi:hypothetical protein